MKIGGLQKLTLIDFPGKISCTVFSLGCSFRCPFCYNPELVLPEKINEVQQISEKDFFRFLKERKGMLEGVCVGGGEPTAREDLPEFCQRIKKLGYEIKIDTNGFNPKMLKDLIDKKLVDYLAMDVKAPKDKYGKIVGLNNWNKRMLENVEESIKILKEGKIDAEFRTTVVPTILDKEDILKIAQWLSPAKKYFLQNFRPEKTIDPKFEKIKPYPENYLLEIQKAISPFFETCQIR
ncbi:anaerobic ribonucleoside-triphosphate reductase activating protein [Patescibacteria group bacterium]|nr:anaerobic ribonucleoside-triphosphate reductase activating protein [Patescibacteria group bacterium]